MSVKCLLETLQYFVLLPKVKNLSLMNAGETLNVGDEILVVFFVVNFACAHAIDFVFGDILKHKSY